MDGWHLAFSYIQLCCVLHALFAGNVEFETVIEQSIAAIHSSSSYPCNHDHLPPCGHVSSAHIHTHTHTHAGAPGCRYGPLNRVEIKRNYAFVEFRELDDAIEAQKKTHGSVMRDRTITVEFVESNRDKDRWGCCLG